MIILKLLIVFALIFAANIILSSKTVNALQFKGMLEDSLSEIEKQALNHAQDYYHQKHSPSIPGQVTLDDMTDS